VALGSRPEGWLIGTEKRLPGTGWWNMGRYGGPPSLSKIEWWPRAAAGAWEVVCIPLWIPFVIVATPTVLLWHRDRRLPPGHCQHCGYDLTGNVSGVCPECETAIGK
jgi:hypothetical protein